MHSIDTDHTDDPSATHDRRALTEAEAATYIGMSRSFLRQDRMNGHREGRTPGPPFVRIGRAIRYLKDDLGAWLEALRITPGPAPSSHHVAAAIQGCN